MSPINPDEALSAAFGDFSATVMNLAQRVNTARAAMQAVAQPPDYNTFDSASNTMTGAGRAIRDYENALEELKGFVQNRNCNVHNTFLKRTIEALGPDKHAIRALEVELVHPKVQNPGDSQGLNQDGVLVDEYLITGVVVRGLISIQPADGNEEPNYSSKSSSSRVPPPPPPQ